MTGYILICTIGPSDIYEGNIKLILGLIWSLISHYQVFGPDPFLMKKYDTSDQDSKLEKKQRRVTVKKLLLNWVNAILPNAVSQNFTTDWNDGLRLSALVDYCRPGLIPDHTSLDPNDGLSNITTAMELAEKELGVPLVLHPDDLAVEKPDELSVITYLSGFYRPALQSLMNWVNSQIPNQPVSNFTTDWADGRALAALVDSVSEGEFSECELMDAEDGVINLSQTIEAAKTLLGITNSVTPETFTENHDIITSSTYISQFSSAKKVYSLSLASRMKASGPGITGDLAKQETVFTVYSRRIPQWAIIDVTVKSADGTEFPVKHQKISNRAQRFHYTPETPGHYTVEVMFNGLSVPGSIFSVTHLPSSM